MRFIGLGMKTVGNDHSRPGKHLNHFWFNILIEMKTKMGMGAGDLHRESGIGYTGIRKRNNSIGSMSITVEQRY